MQHSTVILENQNIWISVYYLPAEQFFTNRIFAGIYKKKL